MFEYPVINGLYISMSFDEVNSLISSLGFIIKPLEKRGAFAGFNSKNNNVNDKPNLHLYFENNKLNRFYLYNWHKFFSLNDTMTFDNLIEIFFQYFLKGYYYETIISENKNYILLKTEIWDIDFRRMSNYMTYGSRNF